MLVYALHHFVCVYNDVCTYNVLSIPCLFVCWFVCFQVHVEFNSDSDKIVLEGPPAEVQQAKESFESFTEDLVHTIT